MSIHLFRFTISYLFILSLAGIFLALDTAGGCTNILVARGASADGSVMVTYSVDGVGVGNLHVIAGREEVDPEVKDAVEADWKGPTFRVVGYLNEHQLAIAETTWDGRPELKGKDGLSYSRLMFLALRRCKTARAAIAEIDRLTRTYGYSSSGETFCLADKNEAWIMDIIGKGPDEKGAVWVAARVPDDCITVSANMGRITTFPMDDPDNWMFSKDVVDFAVRKGFHDAKSGKPFSFRDAYHPGISAYYVRACASRVWSVYRRAAPGKNFSDDFFRGVDGAEEYPLFIKPDKKLSLHDVMQLMRDHFEGTAYDMTKGIDAGPFASPYRYRDLTWEVDKKQFGWQRPISTQQAACVWVAQSRSWLPDHIGGVFWFAPDDAYTSCFAPFYCGISSVPESYRNGRLDRFSWESAWWACSLVANYAYDRWSRVFPDIQAVQRSTEEKFLRMQPVVEETALRMARSGNAALEDYLTDYSNSCANQVFQKWKELAGQILVKHNDGWLKDPGQMPRGIGYPEPWRRRVVKERGEDYRIGGQ
ncbi:MAG: C69 family dipeptidase [Verrucomicrobiales bacterium]|nr:C69 family dipeptidase [Verrucomicrobiales bacterium]